LEEWGPLVPAVARLWPKVTESLGEVELERFESGVLVALRALDGARTPAETDAAARAVAAAFEARAPLGDLLAAEFGALSGAEEVFGPQAPPPHWTAYRRSLLVPVMYATDRAPTGTAVPGGASYGSARGEPACGQVLVPVPDDHRVGALDKPGRWRLGFLRDRGRDPGPVTATQLTPEEFERGVRSQLDPGGPREALVFLHGYNVAFADAALRAAQIAYDLNFTGVTVLYSWPSAGGALDYAADGNAARRSVPYFREFLRRLLTGTGVEEVHILAHSMGNRVLTDALDGLDTTALPAGSGRLGQVVFAAPDVDAEVFRQLLPGIVRQARGCTLYASSRDRALAVSRTMARFARAGQAGEGIVVAPGLDTVDATGLDTGLLGHSYVGDHRSVLSDLYALLRQGHPPSRRFGLTPVPHPDGTYWSFQPQK
jgi:esterase/lipase superfamily enzyme